MINDLGGTNRRMCFWLYFIAQTTTRTCDPFSICSVAAANGRSSSRRPAVVHRYIGANRKVVSISEGTRYFASEELWIKSKAWCLHWLHRRLIIPQNVATLQNGRFEKGVHRKVCYVLQAEARFLRSICLCGSCHYNSKCSSSDNFKKVLHSNEQTQV